MFNKTTSSQFLNYGSLVDIDIYYQKLYKESATVYLKSIPYLYYYEKEICINVDEGIALLIVTDSDSSPIEEFVIHRTLQLKGGIYFNLIPLTYSATISIASDSPIISQRYHLSIVLEYTSIFPRVHVTEIYSYYYMVKEPGYRFSGEKHYYYELTYVDNGILETVVERVPYSIDSGCLMIYGPHQFHTQEVNSNKSCSYMTIIFNLHCPIPELLMSRVFRCHKELSAILNKFIVESNLSMPYSKELLLVYLKELIIMLFQYDNTMNIQPAKNPINQHFDNELMDSITSYIEEKIYEPLTIDDICDHFSISRSSLQNLFKNNLNIPPKKYINDLKLSKSKLLIKENNHTITDIAFMLGFNSIHYFSRKFSQQYNITPSEYAKSIYSKLPSTQKGGFL